MTHEATTEASARLVVRPGALNRSLMEPGTPAVAQRALQLGGVLAVITYLLNRRLLDVLAVAGGAALFFLARAAYRSLYFHNSAFAIEATSVRHTNALGLSRVVDRSAINHIVVVRGSMPTFMSPAISPKVLVWSAAGGLLLRASAKYFAPEDLKRMCSAIGVPTDGPDGVWIR